MWWNNFGCDAIVYLRLRFHVTMIRRSIMQERNRVCGINVTYNLFSFFFFFFFWGLFSCALFSFSMYFCSSLKVMVFFSLNWVFCTRVCNFTLYGPFGKSFVNLSILIHYPWITIFIRNHMQYKIKYKFTHKERDIVTTCLHNTIPNR